MLSTVVVYIPPLSLNLIQTLTLGEIDAPLMCAVTGWARRGSRVAPSPFSVIVASASLRYVSHPLSLCLTSKP
jgi:hypothetical protein